MAGAASRLAEEEDPCKRHAGADRVRQADWVLEEDDGRHDDDHALEAVGDAVRHGRDLRKNVVGDLQCRRRGLFSARVAQGERQARSSSGDLGSAWTGAGGTPRRAPAGRAGGGRRRGGRGRCAG